MCGHLGLKWKDKEGERAKAKEREQQRDLQHAVVLSLSI